ATNIMSRQGLDDKDYYVLDIGVGDGKQLCEIIRKDSFGGRIHLAILDPSERLLEKAVERLMDLRDARIVEIRKVFDRIENITVGSLLQLFGCPMHAAIASNSLHHVPYEQKGPVLSVIRGVCKMLLLHELDAEHDRPERGDDALIYSVWRVFNKSIELTLGGDLLSEYKEIAIKSFFVPEARNILLKPRAERGDYHTTKEQWADLIADGAGEIGACEDGGCELVESACTFESGPMKMQFQAYAFGVINPA
ncbi:MAG: class I SAM-dependent methyltransferase, partial [bacterium]